MEQEQDQSSRCRLRMRILILVRQTEWTWRADLSKFVRVQTDSEDELLLFLAKIVSVISSGSSSESMCAGCRGGYNRDASSPSDNVILVRKEQHLHYNVVTGSHLAWWMFTTTPIFHAPMSDVSPFTLLRLKFQKKLGPNYRLNNDYFLSGPLGLTSISFCFCCCKSCHGWFCTLDFLCYWTGSMLLWCAFKPLAQNSL